MSSRAHYRLSGSVRKNEAAAGDLAVKVNIGLFDDADIIEFRHDLLLFNK